MPSNKISKRSLACLALFIAASLLLLNQLPLAHASADNAAPTPTEPAPVMMSTSDRMKPPPTVYPPTQADQGAQLYYLICMTCHGDRGQGLTEEWRNSLGAPDNNCWQSKCHASNHPPAGFVLPKVVPPVVSPHLLANYQTAKGLHTYIQQRMPYQAPASLKADEYWQLTAYIMRINGADPGQRVLDDTSAAAISFDTSTRPTADSAAASRYYFYVIGALAVALIALFAVWRSRR